MATTQQALKQIQFNDAAVKKSLDRFFLNAQADIKGALQEIGVEAVAHSIATHEYQNRTMALEKSHGFVVAGSGETVAAVYESPNGQESFSLSSPKDEITLYLYAGMFYAIYVELKNGFSVLLNTFMMLKRDGNRMLAEKLRNKSVR